MTYSLAFTQSLYIILLIAAKVQRQQFEFVPAQRISEVLGMSPATVAAILRRLHHAGLIETREGANGGVRLAKLPDTITVLDVFAAIEQDRPLFQVSTTSKVAGDKPAIVNQTLATLLENAEESMKQSLRDRTIQQILDMIG